MLKDYRLIPPSKADSLVVLMHGVGADGQDLLSLGEMWRGVLPRTAFVSPDAPEAYDMAPFGRQWFSLRDWTVANIEEGLRRVTAPFDAYLDGLLSEFALPASRCVLVGFSQGTMTALHVGLRRAETLGGILGYSGGLFGTEKLADEMRSRPPVCLIHGRVDEVVPFSASELALHHLKLNGVDASFHAIEGLGHGINDEGLSLGAAFLQRTLK